MGEINLTSILFGVFGLLIGIVIMTLVNNAGLTNARKEAKRVLEDSRKRNQKRSPHFPLHRCVRLLLVHDGAIHRHRP